MSNVQKIIKYVGILLAGFIILSIISLVFEVIGFFIPESADKLKSFNQEYNNIVELDIDVGGTQLLIQKGDKFSIVASDVSKSFEVKERNGVLEIDEKSQKFFSKNKGIITITINDTILNKLDIDHGAGKLIITDINVNYFELDQGAGKVEISNVSFLNTNIDGGFGSTFISSSTLRNLELDMGIGKVEINADIKGNSTISCGIGELILDLLGNKDDYQVIVDKGVGSVKVDGIKKKDDSIYGNGLNKINIDGGIGTIHVDFK